ncbi:MAG TPA: DNA polymerase III subunit delta [Fimbriimonadaceae bacterium]|nr:DNA polymerase III subunit delta [Fimbriimonadaceae bacterium]HRJ34081.1 DNA polymerase III subunit delta [Fimbriimonadaceae bacterium]
MKIKLDSAARAQFVLISGEESSLREQALHQLLELWESGPDDFDCESVVASERGPRDWIQTASTTPFLGTHRTVVVRHLLRLGSPRDVDASVWKELGELPETGRILLVVDDEVGDESKQRDLASLATSWEKAVSGLKSKARPGYAEVVLAKIEVGQIQEYLVQAAAQAGKTLSRASASLLIEKTAQSVTLASEELQKLILYVGDEKQIREADIEASVITTREWNVFKMLDATLAGRLPEAHRHLRILMQSNQKAEETAFRSILPTLHSQLRLLWQARIYLDSNVSPGADSSSLSHLMPERPNLAKEPEWKRNRIMQSARSIRFGQLSQAFRELADADARLKGQLDLGATGYEALELLLLRLQHHLKPAGRPPARTSSS